MNELISRLFSSAADSWHTVFILVLVVVVHFLAEPLRWRLYLGKSSEEKRLSVYLNVFNFTALLSYVIPLKMGLPARLWLLNRYLSKDAALLVSVLTIDGLVYYSIWLLACIWAGYAAWGAVLDIFAFEAKSFLILLSLFAIAVVLLVVLLRKLRGLHILQRLEKSGKEIVSGLNAVAILGIVTVFLVDLSSQVFRHWMILYLLGYNIEAEVILGITAVSIFAGMISFLPLGLGAYDVILVSLLVSVSVPLQDAILVPLINRGLSLSVALLLGMWGALSLGMHPFHRGWIRSIRENFPGK